MSALFITTAFKGAGKGAEAVGVYTGYDKAAAIKAGEDAIGFEGVTRAQVYQSPIPIKRIGEGRVLEKMADAAREANLARAAKEAAEARAKREGKAEAKAKAEAEAKAKAEAEAKAKAEAEAKAKAEAEAKAKAEGDAKPKN